MGAVSTTVLGRGHGERRAKKVTHQAENKDGRKDADRVGVWLWWLSSPSEPVLFLCYLYKWILIGK